MNYEFSKYEFNGIYTYVSTNTITGFKPDELIGKSAYNMFYPFDLEQIVLAHANLTSINRTSAIYRLRTKKNGYIWVRSYSERTSTELISLTFKLSKFQIFLFKIGFYKQVTNNEFKK